MNKLALIILLPLTVTATEKPHDKDAQPVPARSTAHANSVSAAASRATAVVQANPVSTAASTAGSVAEQSLQIQDRLQAPAVSAPAIYASGSCGSGKSIGLAGPGFGVSGGKSTVDANCDRREAARVLTALNPALALRVMCSDPYVAAVASPGDCIYAAATQADPVAPEVATKQDVADAVDRAFKQSVAK